MRAEPQGTRLSYNERYANTLEIGQYLRDEGYQVIEMWECVWKALRIDPPRTYYTPTEHLFRMSQKAILQGIEDELIFGIAEVDIHVPELLKPYFEDLTPIFKNIDVTMADIGPTMRTFCSENDASFTGCYLY